MEVGIYLLKEDFLPLLKIPYNQYQRRQDELLEWLKNFYDYDIIKTRPVKIRITAVYDEYEPLPSQYDIVQKTYDNFIDKELSTEFKGFTRTYLARKSINLFGKDLFGHNDVRNVARRQIKRSLERKTIEKSESMVWLNHLTNAEMAGEDLQSWMEILKEARFSDDTAWDFVSSYAVKDMEEVEELAESFRGAMTTFKAKHGYYPVRGFKYRRKPV